jgi:hypothetical protein
VLVFEKDVAWKLRSFVYSRLLQFPPKTDILVRGLGDFPIRISLSNGVATTIDYLTD